MPGAGSLAAAPMLQFTSVEQQQCPIAMPYPWAGDLSPMGSMAAWTPGQQSMPQAQPLVALAPQAPPQMQPIEASVGAIEAQSSQQLMWQPPTTTRPAPGTPRGSKHQVEESPSTPLNRVGLRSVASPAMPSSPWCAQLRTPSPDQGNYNMNSMAQFKAAQQPPALNLAQADADPWAGTTLMVSTQDYYAESEAYMSVTVGTQLRAVIDSPHCGDAKCAWPTYVYCSQGAVAGWVPQQLLWRCYIDDSGRRWACDDSTGSWCWVDEMEKNAGLGGA